GHRNEQAVLVARVPCNPTAWIWYALAMVCLFELRRRDPHMPRPYKVPLYPVLPALVLVMSLCAAGIYAWYYRTEKPVVLWLTLIMYAVGLVYYFGFARRRLVSAAPEELAARAGHEDNPAGGS